MKKQFQSKSVPRGTRTIWRYLGALFILFTFAIGNVWAAESATNNPATVEYGTGSAKKTFLDVSNTVSNATISTGSVACVTYGLFELDKNWKPAFYSGPANGSSSSFNYSGAASVGFLPGSSAGSGTAANKSATSGYGAAKYKSTAPATIYVTGITGIAVMGKDADTKNEKRLYIKVEEYAADGTCTPVGEGDGVTKSEYNKSLHITTYDAGTLSGTKYYKVTLYAGYDTNHETSQIRFTKYIIPATKYSVTYKAGEGTGDDVVDSDAKTVKAFADCSFTAPTGYEFKEWQDGSSNVVEAGAPVSDNMTLTAIYRLIPTKYTVEYILNGPSGDAPTETSKAKDDVFTLAAAPSWAGHAFDGWLCSADAAVKAAGASYTMTAANTTFTAQWHELDCKIYSFTGGIGSAVKESSDKASVDADKLVLSGSAGIIKLVPAAGETFKAGDVITISGTVGNTAEAFGVKISASNGKGYDLGVASVAGTTVPLIASVALTGNADNLYIVRNGGTTTTIYTCEVHRSCAEGAAAGLSYATAEVNKTEGDAAFTNALTNANGLVVAGYSSSNTAVATVDKAGQVTIVAPGTATITAHSAVQTKAGTLYAAGTATYTLNVAALPKYHVTYDLNGGSGDVAEVDHKAGEKFTLHDGVTGVTAPTSKTFVNWKDQDEALFAGGAEYTMPAKNVTLTAQWAGDVYTVKYMDGETVLDTKVVEVGSHPTDIEHPTKPLYTFASWQLSGSDVVLDDVNGTKDAEIILTVRWAKVYAQTADLAAEAAGDKTAIATFLAGKGYVATVGAGGAYDTNASGYLGYKFKNNGDEISFYLQSGKVAELAFMYIETSFTISVDGIEAEVVANKTTSSTPLVKYLYANGADKLVSLVNNSADSKSSVINKITIRDPYQVSYDPHGADAINPQNATPSVTLPTPVNGTGNFKGWYDAETEGNKIGNAGASYTPTANITLHAQWEVVSTDNTLSDLQVDGATVAGFDPAVQIYNLVYEYGQQPVITSATATAGALATVTINNTPVEEATFKYVQVKVEAESGAQRFYQVRYTNNPKQGATIFKAELTSNTAADYSGMYADGDNSEIKLADDGANGYKFSGTSNYVKMAIADATFAEGDMLKMTYTTNPQQGELAIYDGTTKLQGTAYSNHILTFSDAADGKSTLFIRRTDDNNFNGWVAQVEVQRYMAPIIKSYKIGAVSGTIDQEHKTIAIELPYGTSLYGVAATIEAYANGGATVIAPTPLAYDTPLGYKVSSAYAEDGDVDYTVTITEAEHYEAMIVGGANYTTLAAAVAAAQADDVVKLLDNVDLMATGLTIAENITLDLNGFNIKAGEQIDNDIVVPAGKKLTLVDNSANAEGKIYTEQAYAGAATGYGLVRVAGELLMQSGNIYAVIESDPANLGQFAVVLGAGGKATIEGGQIKAGWYAISNNGNNTGSTIIVSGGELISTADFAIYNPAKESTVTVSGGVVYGAAGGIAMNRGELTVTGGTITSKDQGTTGTWGDGTGGLSNAAIAASGKYESVEVEISGGTIIAEGTAVMITNGTTNPVEVAISGGQFSHVVPAEYCADGFAPVTEPNAQGKYEVEDKRIYIFDGSTMSNMATSPSGAISWEIVGSTMGAGDKDKTYEGVHYTRALSCGSSSTTKHFRIDVALNNAAKIEVIGMSNSSSDTRHAWLTNSTEKGDFADAIAGLTTTGYNPEMFTTDWLEEGSYYLHSDNTVAIFLIRVTSKEVDPKCEQPMITTQPATDLTFGAGNMTATVVAEVSDGGTLKYQWYNASDDSEVTGQTTATLTTAEEGTYYVIVTNTLDNHRDNSIKSDEAQLAHRVMDDATLSALSYGTPATAIVLEADKYDYRVDLAMGTTDVPALAATATMAPYPTVLITDATEFVNYEATSTVLVTAEDGVTQKTYTVKFVVDHIYTALVDVTESTTWNWSGSEEAVINDVANKGLIIANYIDGANFEMIEGKENERARRNQNGGVYQGTQLHFNTTVYGKVKIYFRAPSSGDNCTIYVNNNGKRMNVGNRGNSFGWTKEVVVKGDVVIEMVKDGGGDTRVQQIVFTQVAPDYTRNVSNNIGTLCVDHNVVVGGAMGATFYQIASRNELYNDKIDFEEVLPNEELKAGEPYIFKSTTGKIELFYGATAVTEPEAVRGMHGWFDAAAPIDPTKFMMLDITEVNKEDILYISSNKLWNCGDLVGVGLQVVNNRAYIVMSDVPTYAEYQEAQTSNPAPRRRVTLGRNAEQVATGIEDVQGDKVQCTKMLINGQLFILRGEKMYDAKGQLVK